MKKVLVLVFSNLKHDARVMRQVSFLKKNYEVTVCCHDSPTAVATEVILLPTVRLSPFQKLVGGVLLLCRRFSMAYDLMYPYETRLHSVLNDTCFDAIIANDIETLPLAFRLKGRNTRVVFDAHEYAPGHFEDRFWWRIFFRPFNTFLCRTYIPKIDGMMTIGQGLADEYERNFGKRPVVVT